MDRNRIYLLVLLYLLLGLPVAIWADAGGKLDMLLRFSTLYVLTWTLIVVWHYGEQLLAAVRSSRESKTPFEEERYDSAVTMAEPTTEPPSPSPTSEIPIRVRMALEAAARELAVPRAPRPDPMPVEERPGESLAGEQPSADPPTDTGATTVQPAVALTHEQPPADLPSDTGPTVALADVSQGAEAAALPPGDAVSLAERPTGSPRLSLVGSQLAVEPLIERVAKAMQAPESNDRCIKRLPGGRVRVVVSELIPDEGPKQTIAHHRKQFRQQLDKRVASIGWRHAKGAAYTYQREPASP